METARETLVADVNGTRLAYHLTGSEEPLVLVGDRDLPDFIATTDCYVQGLPLATRVVLPGVGHLANLEDPAMFNAIVLAFLRKVTTPVPL